MSIGERILLLLSREPGEDQQGLAGGGTEEALSLLQREFSGFADLVSGKRVLDFGCGSGHQSVALALEHDCQVTGLDTNRKSLARARNLADSYDIPSAKLVFAEHADGSMAGSFDIVISQNSFEHFRDPVGILNEMKRMVSESGKILITFGPPWLAPHGSHMQFFCRIPWVNILFSEKTVMKVRSRFRNDGATRYEDIESGLNRMTVAKFERIVSSAGLRIEFQRYRCVKGIDLLSRVPGLRELFINHISVVLSKG